jgi:hypothetical protein
MKIDCHDCVMFQTSHCEDCLVTALLHAPSAPVEIEEDMEPSLQTLAGAGLIPVLRFRAREPDPEAAQGKDPLADAG